MRWTPGATAAPLRNRPFRLLFIGQVISRTGDHVFQVALAYYAVAVARDASLLAYTLFGQATGTVGMLLIGGALTDRVGARRMLLCADAVRVVAVAIIAALALGEAVPVWAVVLGGLLLGLGDGMFEPAYTVAFAEILPEHQLLAANSLHAVVLRATAIGGAAIGGVAVATVGSSAALLLDAASFALAGVLVLLAGTWAARRHPAEAGGHLLRELRTGLAYVMRTAWIWRSILVFGLTVALVLGPAKVLLPIIATDELDAGPGTYATWLAMQGVGALLAALAVGQRARVRHRGRVIFFGLIIANGGFAVVALSHSAALSAAALVASGAAITIATIAWASALQSLVPRELLGRVSSVDWVVSLGAAPAALAVTPVLLDVGTADVLLIVASSAALLACAAALTTRPIRQLA